MDTKLLFISVLLLSPLSRAMGEAECSPVDRKALLDFKSTIIRDQTGILSSWVGTNCCGGWEGVDCNANTGRVTSLQLERPGGLMKGTLSPSLGDLKFLQVLVINGMKQISGTIPQSFTSLLTTKNTSLSPQTPKHHEKNHPPKITQKTTIQIIQQKLE
ncbi:hypothetical protein LUZ60_015853 [Juncus effusus]|nr:hypothetical protein LUZ60_015853 [Juncus effusus]